MKTDIFPHASIESPSWLGARSERKSGAALKPGLIISKVGWLNSSGSGGRLINGPRGAFSLGLRSRLWRGTGTGKAGVLSGACGDWSFP